MNISKINQIIFLLNKLYYSLDEIDSFRYIIYQIKKFNYKLDDLELKDAFFSILQFCLSDGTHYVKYNGRIYDKKNNNYEEFLTLYSPIYDELISFINSGAENGSSFEYNKILERDLFLLLTDEWKNELCKLSKLGYENGLNHNCKFDPNHQYQMPNPPFIPNNDCGCEE